MTGNIIDVETSCIIVVDIQFCNRFFLKMTNNLYGDIFHLNYSIK